MNNIQEKDWAEEDWHGHTGMDSASDYCHVPPENEPVPDDAAKQKTNDGNGK